MPKYVLSRRASSDLDGIWDYTYERWGLEQAESYTNAIRGALAMLVEHPQRRRPYDAVKGNYFEQSYGTHVIFYTASGENILVVRVLHQRMDFMRHLF